MDHREETLDPRPSLGMDGFEDLAQRYAGESRHGRRNAQVQPGRCVGIECPIEGGETCDCAREACRQSCSPSPLMPSLTKRASREQAGQNEAVYHTDGGTGCEPEKSTR
jgi:hypothetical protein